MIEWIRVDPLDPDRQAIVRACSFLGSGGTVILPTETVYGLAARADDPRAVDAVYRLKGRPGTKALPCQVASLAQAGDLCSISPAHLDALARLWPGPLTAVLRRRSGGDTLAVRIPAHPVALAVLIEIGAPLVVTSANRSGQPPCIEAASAAASLLGDASCGLDAGRLGGGIASTVLDLTKRPPEILRRGPLSPERLADVLGCDVMAGRDQDG